MDPCSHESFKSRIDCQFALQRCDSVWWRRVPQRKMVSQCRSCNRKYQPVPRDREWGSGALFNCTTCDNTFRLTATKGTACMCRLGTDGRAHIAVLPVSGGVWPTRVQCPDTHSAAHPSGQQLSCMAEDCYNPQAKANCGESLRSVCFVHREHAWQGPRVPGTHCVHARTLHVTRRVTCCVHARTLHVTRRVTCCVHASEPHVSSASTVATCISQGSLVEHEDVLIEQDLLEEDENRRH
ncbi:LOW QUALITY PROTEIN: shiftless antiviral inhibitor of ribosomal frameshifting protein [Petromyzon marinus]|uniref:LOW QUALITY PROTEIN: shiftless antiviral inhibitor of ribosomal frameshifting protein n=1 Tax=Petromyzon marinus TaxID=7757 RepID=UPI003F72A4B8